MIDSDFEISLKEKIERLLSDLRQTAAKIKSLIEVTKDHSELVDLLTLNGLSMKYLAGVIEIASADTIDKEKALEVIKNTEGFIRDVADI